MLGGIIAGAMGGGGQAVQQNAMSRIEQLRAEALQKLSHEYDMARQGHDQEFRRGERIEGQEFTAGENQANREQNRQLAEMRERGANSRVGAGRNDWQLVPLEGGGYGRYNARTNQFEEANLPPGTQLGGGELSARDKYRLDDMSSQINAIRKRAGDEMRELTTEEKAELGRLQGQFDSLLGTGRGATPLERLLAGEDLSGEVPASEGGEGPADRESVRGLLNQEIEEQRNTQEANAARRQYNAARDKADSLIDRIDRELAGGASPGGLMAGINEARGQSGQISDSTLAEAQQVAEELLSLDDNPNISADQRRWIAERLMRLRDAGVPVGTGE